MTLTDGTLQAFADTLIPGRKAGRTDLGNEIHPKAIAGVHPEPGAVQADTLLLYHHPLIGFDLLAPAFLADLEARSLLRLGQFLDLPFAKRVEVCRTGSRPRTRPPRCGRSRRPSRSRRSWPGDQKNATIDNSSGLQVMGHPGIAPQGYADHSYRRVLSRERTTTGSLP